MRLLKSNPKKSGWAVFLTLVICFLVPPVEAKYGGGTGEPNNPYLIYTSEQMNAIGADVNDWGSHFLLTNDINLAEFTGTQFNIIGISDTNAFTGVFDGNGHTISNFTYTTPGTNYIGLFGYVGTGGEIKDVGLVDADVNAGNGDYVGSLVGYLYHGTITNCHTDGVYITGDKYIGAMVGRNSGELLSGTGRIINCYATGVVNGNYMTGGLVGSIYLGWVSDCNSAVTVVGNKYTGGLVGFSSSIATVRNCFATGTVDGNSSTGGLLGSAGGDISSVLISNCYATGDVSGIDYTGGLIGNCGHLQVSASNCYATGAVNGANYTGGLVGSGEDFSNCYATGVVNGYNNTGGFAGSGGSIRNCYATGNVDGNSNIGGLVGNVCWSISNCYAVGFVNGKDNIGGLVGYDRPHFITSYTKCFWDSDVNPDLDGIGNIIDPPDVIGESTTNMQTESTFTDAGWDFTTPIWIMCDEPGYPKLWWEKCPIEATVEIKPNTLNLKSKGNWISCRIRLGADYDIADIDPDSVLLEGEIESASVHVNEQSQVVIAKFSREDVCQMLADIGELGQVELLVSGKLHDGTRFGGTAIIRVIDKGKKK
jgi:hypothetical protein